MTNEEFEKKMEFIVEQQAQLVINQEKADGRMTRLENLVGRLATASLERFENIEEKVEALVDSQVRLTDAQSRTDENLRNLIAVVDRYFSEGRNGKSEG
jgi:tetrahydromethanopterin S-methyltransferase subunit G